MILPTLGFGVPNLLARDDKTKYFPEQFIHDVYPSLRADQIVHKVIRSGMDIDGDVLYTRDAKGNTIRYFVDFKHNIFEKLEEN